MNGCNAFYCFELDDQAVVYEKIEPGFAYGIALVAHAGRHLSGKANVAQRQFNAQRFLINGFQEAWAEKAVHLDRSTNDTVSKLVKLCTWLHHVQILGVLGVLAVHALESATATRQLLAVDSNIPGHSLI